MPTTCSPVVELSVCTPPTMRETTKLKMETEHHETCSRVVELSVGTPPTMLETTKPKKKTEPLEHRRTATTTELNRCGCDIELDKGSMWHGSGPRIGIELDKGSTRRRSVWRPGRHRVRVDVESPCEREEVGDLRVLESRLDYWKTLWSSTRTSSR